VRGTSHIRTGLRCQDASKCELKSGGTVLSVVLSDGAGSAAFGGEGASLVCRTITEHVRRHFEKQTGFPTDDTVWSWIDECRDRIVLAASHRAIDPRQFSSTLIGALIGNEETVIFHIGDGAVALRMDGAWSIPSWPESGEYASTTYFVTDEPSPRLRISRLFGAVTGMAAFTDGLERLALNFAEQKPHAPFFNGIIQPLDILRSSGSDKALREKLSAYLNSAPVNDRTDDDKTLVLASRL
jgi:hypothetical protein